MTRATHDYPALKQEYITSEISIRALCEKHGIRSWSTVNEKKNKEGWDDLRAAFKMQLAEREVGKLVTERLKLVTDIHAELLVAVRYAVRRFIDDVGREKDPQPVSARDLMGMIDKFLLLSGSTPNRTENRNFDTHSFTLDGLLDGAPPELLRELAELAHDRGAASIPVGRGPLVVLEGASA